VADDIPKRVRDFVVARDGSCCRICGQWVETPALHHINFRSQGKREGRLHLPENLVCVGWLPGHDCHLPIAHGPRALVVREVLWAIAEHPHLTALQVARANGLRLT